MSLAAALAQAHRTGRPVSAASLPVPESLAAAEDVQSEVAGLLTAETAGWKIGMVRDGATPVAAPLFRHLIVPDGADVPSGKASFVAIEVEIGFVMQADFMPADIEAALGPAFMGIEVVRSRFLEGPKAPFHSFLADNIANGAYVVGADRPDWRELDLSRLRCRVWRDENLAHDAPGGHPQGNPIAPMQALAARPVARLGGLKAGQLVTTGTLCGVMRIDRPTRLRTEVEGFGTMAINLT